MPVFQGFAPKITPILTFLLTFCRSEERRSCLPRSEFEIISEKLVFKTNYSTKTTTYVILALVVATIVVYTASIPRMSPLPGPSFDHFIQHR